MEDWQAVAAEVAEGLAEGGQELEVLRRGPRTGPAHATVAGPETVLRATVVDVGFKTMYKNGSTVRDSMKTFLVSPIPLSAGVQVGDRFVKGGEEYSVEVVDETSPAETTVLWEVKCSVK